MPAFFSARPLPAFPTVYALLRIATGLLVLYHGWEVFDGAQMEAYGKWLTELRFPAPYAMAWLGKIAELVAGIGLTIGFGTRIMCVLLVIIMLGVSFGMGHGKVWYEDQHPFMFVLLGVMFFFGGSGKWSVEGKIND